MYNGTPQWSLDALFISPFTAKRKFDEDGVPHWEKLSPVTAPTGIIVMDHFLRRLTAGQGKVDEFWLIYGLRVEDLDSLIYILTGMPGYKFRLAYQLRLADELLRYTELSLHDVAKRSGLGTHSNLCVVLGKYLGLTPTGRRIMLRRPGDAGRYRL